jgi:hypothetical protein
MQGQVQILPGTASNHAAGLQDSIAGLLHDIPQAACVCVDVPWRHCLPTYTFHVLLLACQALDSSSVTTEQRLAAQQHATDWRDAVAAGDLPFSTGACGRSSSSSCGSKGEAEAAGLLASFCVALHSRHASVSCASCSSFLQATNQVR